MVCSIGTPDPRILEIFGLRVPDSSRSPYEKRMDHVLSRQHVEYAYVVSSSHDRHVSD